MSEQTPNNEKGFYKRGTDELATETTEVEGQWGIIKENAEPTDDEPEVEGQTSRCI